MIRYSMFAIAVLATAATAVAAVAPSREDTLRDPANITIIEKNEIFPILGPVIVEQCAVEDCSDVPG